MALAHVPNLPVIPFALVVVPFVSYVAEPGRGGEVIKRFKVWLTSHERPIAHRRGPWAQ